MQPIRIPSVFANTLRQIAREMDGLAVGEELIFTCKMKNPEALQSQDFLEATEVSIKVTHKLDIGESENVKEILSPTAEALAEAEPPAESSNELDLSILVDQTFAATTSESEAETFDADAVIEQMVDVEYTSWFHETEPVALEPQKPLENTTCNIDHWHQAIGDVNLSANDALPAVEQLQASALLDLSELSTLFAVQTEQLSFDPDAVIESLQVHIDENTSDSSPLVEAEAFDPDVVIESALESLEMEQASDQAIAHETVPRIPEAEIKGEIVNPLGARAATVATIVNETTENVAEFLPPIVVPPIQLKSLDAFAETLFATWQQLATQKLKQQERPQAKPWGVAVELNALYRRQFTEMNGNHFLKRVQEAVLAKKPGLKKIQLIVIPGLATFTIAGVEASAISYKEEREECKLLTTPVYIQKSNHDSLDDLKTVSPTMLSTPKGIGCVSGSIDKSTQALLLKPMLDEDMAHLLRERSRHVATQGQEGQARPNWLRWLPKF